MKMECENNLETNPENYSLDLVRKIGHILLIFGI